MSVRKILLGILVVGLAGIVYWNSVPTSKPVPNEEGPFMAEDPTTPIASQKADYEEPASFESEKTKELVPDDPAKYGMVVIPEGQSLPQTVEEWEDFMTKSDPVAKASGAEGGGASFLDTPEAQQVLTQVQLPKTEFAQKMAKLDSSIAKIQKQVNDNPYDEDAKKRLILHLQLKAAGKMLEKKVAQP